MRGIQEIAITQPIGNNIFAFKYLLAYFVLIATVGTLFIALQRRQAAIINGMNVELETANEFLGSLSTETYALVRDTVVARVLPPITMKGISREVIPYLVSGVLDATGKNVRVFSEHVTGLDFYFNAGMIDSAKAPHIRILQGALKALDDG